MVLADVCTCLYVRVCFKVPMPLAAGRVYQQLAFGPKDMIAASSEGMVHLLSATTGELLDTIPEAHDATITSMQVGGWVGGTTTHRVALCQAA
jgi:hypothetical protein